MNERLLLVKRKVPSNAYGHHFREARLAKQLSLAKCGEKLGVSHAELGQIELGRFLPYMDPERCQLLADVLGETAEVWRQRAVATRVSMAFGGTVSDELLHFLEELVLRPEPLSVDQIAAMRLAAVGGGDG